MDTTPETPPLRMHDFKYCSRCKRSHLKTDFASNINTPDGLQSWCKKAMRSYRATKKQRDTQDRTGRALDWRTFA
jgi:hypothetical protein